MNNEAAECIAEIRWVLEAQLRCVEGLEPVWLNWRPEIGDANSASAIIGHTHGVTAAFVLGVAGGEPWTRKSDGRRGKSEGASEASGMARDRIAEFETRFESVNEVRERTAALSEALSSLASRDDLDLDEVVLPDEAAWGSPAEGPMQRRRVLLEALRHASIHLGELRFTRSLIDAERL